MSHLDSPAIVGGESSTTPAVPPTVPGTSSQPPIWPSNLPLTEKYMNDPTWPADLVLDREKGNWEEWSSRLNILAERQGFSFWLNGTFSQPPLSDDATRHFTWNINDASLRGFIRQYISIADRDDVADLKSSAQIFAFLSNRYVALGTWAQCNRLADLWNIRFRNGTSMEETIQQIESIHKKVSAMGPINWDKIKAIALVNALSGDFEHLQSSIQQKVEDPNFTSGTVLKCIRHEANLIKRRAEQHPTVPSVSSTALVAQTKTRQRPFCKNCRRPGHSADFCIAPGGKFAGRTIEEAIAAQ
jgi:gag-polypeptide of LTR copia-type